MRGELEVRGVWLDLSFCPCQQLDLPESWLARPGQTRPGQERDERWREIWWAVAGLGLGTIIWARSL